VVDDEAPVREMLGDLLTSEGHEATIVDGAEPALVAAAAGRYHAALVDLSLPGRGGSDLARDLRSEDPALAVIVITGWGRERELAELDPAVVDLTATKPMDLPQLRRLLEHAARLTAGRRGDPLFEE
jgi:DNA-binding response OmpR family regulator